MTVDESDDIPPPRPSVLPRWILASSLSLAFALLCARVGVVGFGPDCFNRISRELPIVLFSATYDVLYVVLLTSFFLLALRMFRNWPVMRGMLFVLYLVASFLSLVACIANIQVVTMIGRPFTYQWMYYSDMVFSSEAWQAVQPSLSEEFLRFAAADVAVWVGLTCVLVLIIIVARKLFTVRELVIALLVLLCGYLWIGRWYLIVNHWTPAKTANPVMAFTKSVVEAMRQPPLLSMPTPFKDDDFATTAERSSTEPATKPYFTAARPAKPISNVIFFVMESSGSRYMKSFGGPYDITPTLDKYRLQSISFDNIYAHTPSTNSTMLSLLCSAYPWPSYKSAMSVSPGATLDSFSKTMKQRGARTAFFSSAELGYGNAEEFLKRHNFDTIQDWRTRKDSAFHFQSKWSYLYGSSDWDTVNSLVKWVDPATNKNPFFAVLWSIQAHYPYYLRGPAKEFSKDPNLNRYLTAIAETDWALGQLLENLEKAGLSESTLVVVLGDHGEAFAQHGLFGHGTALYEENIAIPLVMINPQLFHGEQIHTLGGTVNVAPTVADCLGIPAEPLWQGQSLVSGKAPGRMYFVQPYSDLLFAYHEGNMKMIFNAWSDVTEVYDLTADPWETKNIADTQQDFVVVAKQRLATWLRYQGNYYNRAFITTPAQ